MLSICLVGLLEMSKICSALSNTVMELWGWWSSHELLLWVPNHFTSCCRGVLCQSIIRAQAASPTFTHVYAALVAILNTKVQYIHESHSLHVSVTKEFLRNSSVFSMLNVYKLLGNWAKTNVAIIAENVCCFFGLFIKFIETFGPKKHR